jgi:PAS domain-containing protein
VTRLEPFMADTVLCAAITAVQQGGYNLHQTLDTLPIPVYVTNTEGVITYLNRACIGFSGRTPSVGIDRWCVSWRLYTEPGQFLPHDQCPMAVAVRERRSIRGLRAVAERPDGTRINFLPYPTPFFDGAENFAGAVNVLVEMIEDRSASVSLVGWMF